MGIGKIVTVIGKRLLKKTNATEELVDATSTTLFSFAKKHSLFTKAGELADDGLALVHMTNYAPKTRQILTDRAAFGGTRNSVHTAVNHAVGDVNVNTNIPTSWKAKKYAIILPFRRTVKANHKGKFTGGITCDLWTNGSLTIPRGAVIVRHSSSLPAGKLRVLNAEKIEEFKHLKGVKIVETGDSPHGTIKTVLKKLGYQPLDNPSPAWGGFGSQENEINKLIEEMKVWNAFAKKQGVIPGVHMISANGLLETIIDFLISAQPLKGAPLKKFKNKQLIYDAKQGLSDLIEYCKKCSTETGVPLSLDINTFEEAVKKAENFTDIYNAIVNKLKLKSSGFQDMSIDLITERQLQNAFTMPAHVHGLNKINDAYLNPATEKLTDCKQFIGIPEINPAGDTIYASEQLRTQIEQSLKNMPDIKKPKEIIYVA